MVDKDYEKIFALKPIPKDQRVKQVRFLKPEVRKKIVKVVKEGFVPRKSTTKQG